MRDASSCGAMSKLPEPSPGLRSLQAELDQAASRPLQSHGVALGPVPWGLTRSPAKAQRAPVVIAWRDDLVRPELGGSTVRHRLAVLAALFEYLCEKNAVTHNPVKGVARPKTESGEGKTPALGDHQARKLLTPKADSLKAKRDCAILSALPFHALRREELCKLKVKDAHHARKGVPHLRVSGKGGKRGICRCIPAHRRSFTITPPPPGTATMSTGRCSGR
jgi:integrase